MQTASAAAPASHVSALGSTPAAAADASLLPLWLEVTTKEPSDSACSQCPAPALWPLQQSEEWVRHCEHSLRSLYLCLRKINKFWILFESNINLHYFYQYSTLDLFFKSLIIERKFYLLFNLFKFSPIKFWYLLGFEDFASTSASVHFLTLYV